MKITASAPAKAILFGEHSVNRGQRALAVSIGLRVQCTVNTNAITFVFESDNHLQTCTRSELIQLNQQVDHWQAAQDYAAICQMALSDYFAPAKYIIAKVFGDALPNGLHCCWQSDIPSAGGLGSGGASFVALATALVHAQTPAHTSANNPTTLHERIRAFAYLGDIIAHGGVASGLDTSTCTLGGVIGYSKSNDGSDIALPIPSHPDLSLVIGNTRQRGQTSEVNTRVRHWLAEDATRMHYFTMIGMLSNTAPNALAHGIWPTLGTLMNLNQLILEKIGVSTPAIEALNRAALAAGAYGAKLSGSGGGGIMLALVSPNTKQAVAQAIVAAGGEALLPEVATEGAKIENDSEN